MTARAGQAGVTSTESEPGMVVMGRSPGGGGMTLAAVGAKLTAVGVVAFMTRIAIGWSASEGIIGMATIAGSVHVCAGEYEGSQVVIERGGEPAGNGVTIGAIRTQLSHVGIICLVAGIAIGWGTPVDLVRMAAFTGHGSMPAI